MTPTQADLILGAVGDLRNDIKVVNAKLDTVDGRISRLELADAVGKALVIQAKTVADAKSRDLAQHVLSYRWRVGIGLAAIGGLGGLILGLITLILKLIG